MSAKQRFSLWCNEHNGLGGVYGTEKGESRFEKTDSFYNTSHENRKAVQCHGLASSSKNPKGNKYGRIEAPIKNLQPSSTLNFFNETIEKSLKNCEKELNFSSWWILNVIGKSQELLGFKKPIFQAIFSLNEVKSVQSKFNIFISDDKKVVSSVWKLRKHNSRKRRLKKRENLFSFRIWKAFFVYIAGQNNG